MSFLSDKIEEIERKLSYHFRNPQFLLTAFVHRSFWNEHQEQVKEHNERLEFLGDSVLGLASAHFLYRHFPTTPEGILSDFRSRLVEASSCAIYVQKLALGEYLLLGRGEKMNIGKGRESILADLFEALMGAIYLDGGYEAAEQFFLHHFSSSFEEMLEAPTRNWKAELQDLAQKKYQQMPLYEVIEESGPSHQRHFRIAVFLRQQKIGEGVGSSKKEAQQNAAEDALSRWRGE